MMGVAIFEGKVEEIVFGKRGVGRVESEEWTKIGASLIIMEDEIGLAITIDFIEIHINYIN